MLSFNVTSLRVLSESRPVRCPYRVWLYRGYYGFYLTLSKHRFDYTECITGLTWRGPYRGLVIQMSSRVLPDVLHTGVWLYRCHHGSYLTLSIQGLVIQSSLRVLPECRSACCWPYRLLLLPLIWQYSLRILAGYWSARCPYMGFVIQRL